MRCGGRRCGEAVSRGGVEDVRNPSNIDQGFEDFMEELLLLSEFFSRRLWCELIMIMVYSPSLIG